MALNEQIVTGRSFRKCIDVANKLWQKISFWTKASDVEFDDGENAETKLGSIKGITADLNTTETGYAADMTALTQLNNQIDGLEQYINNKYSELNTKVDNAISGGDLAAPYTLNLLNTPYTDVGWNPYNADNSIWYTKFSTANQTSFSGSQPKGTNSYSGTIYRNYATPIKIGKKFKLKYNFSGSYLYTYSSQGLSLQLLEGNVALQTIKAGGDNYSFSTSGELDLSLYENKTIYLRFVMGVYTGCSFSANFNTVTITNR